MDFRGDWQENDRIAIEHVLAGKDTTENPWIFWIHPGIGYGAKRKRWNERSWHYATIEELVEKLMEYYALR